MTAMCISVVEMAMLQTSQNNFNGLYFMLWIGIISGSREFPANSSSYVTRVLHGSHGKQGLRTFVEETYLQGDSEAGRRYPWVLQIS